MKKSITTIISFILGIATTFGIAGCNSIRDPVRDPVEELGSDFFGAYFITDKGYETYVRNCALQVGADKQWISDVLNGGDGGEWHYLIRPQSWFWCAIADNQITVSKIEDMVYDITVGENSYLGSSITNTISFWFSGDFLYLSDNGETLEFEKDKAYIRAESGSIALAAPQNVITSCGGEGLDFVMFQWDYRSDYGNFGAATEIKTPGSEEYEAVKGIERVYMNSFVVQLDESQFEVGENLVRLYHIGGPSITNDHSIIVYGTSDYATYRVIINDNGSVEIQK